MSLSFHESGFLHRSDRNVQVHYFRTENCIGIIEAESDISLDELLKDIVRECNEAQFVRLADFETFILNRLQRSNAPVSASLVCILYNEGKLLIKTVGGGMLYLNRGGKKARLVYGNSSASGFIRQGDCVVATTQSLIDTIGSGEKFMQSFFYDEIPKNIHSLTGATRNRNSSLVAVYVKWEQESIPAQNVESPQDPIQGPALAETLKEFWSTKRDKLTRKKTITLGVLAVIFIIFIWSVGLGYYRHQQNQTQKKITTAKETITQKLMQAEEVSFLNSARAQALLIDARADLKLLKEEIKDEKNGQIIALEQQIARMESRVLKKEEKAFTEFFDLTVDQKNAKGDKMAYSEGYAAILNKSGGAVYLLSLEKKSLDKKTAPQINSADSVAVYKEEAYVIKPGDGIYKLLDANKSVRVIPVQKEWGAVTDAALFNGNMYILDGVKNDIYKFVAADNNTFASAGGYFKGTQPRAIGNPVSLAIDGSVYIISSNAAVKYTSGLRDGFAPQFPTDTQSFRKVLTQEDEGKIYIWDKENGTVYVVNKEGGYERQIQSSILKSANDIIAHDRKAYVLQGSKIYTIDLN